MPHREIETGYPLRRSQEIPLGSNPVNMEIEDDAYSVAGDDAMDFYGAQYRYADYVQSNPNAARKSLPPMSAIELVRQARNGDTQARQKIETAVTLAHSAFPDALTAVRAERNFLRAAALEKHGVKVESLYPDHIGAMLDDEEEMQDTIGLSPGLGLLPLLAAGIGAFFAWLFLHKPAKPDATAPSAASSAASSAAAALSAALGGGTAAIDAAWSKYKGQPWSVVPQDVRTTLQTYAASASPGTMIVFPWTNDYAGGNPGAEISTSDFAQIPWTYSKPANSSGTPVLVLRLKKGASPGGSGFHETSSGVSVTDVLSTGVAVVKTLAAIFGA